MKNVTLVLIFAAVMVVLGLAANDQAKQPAPVRQAAALDDLEIVHPPLHITKEPSIADEVPITVKVDDNEEASLHLVYRQDKVEISEGLNANRPELSFRAKDSNNTFSLYRVTEIGPAATCDGCWRVMTRTDTGGLRDEVVDETKIQAKIDSL